MIHLTTWESLDDAEWNIKIEYDYYPYVQKVIIQEIYCQEPVKHIDDLQWVEFDQYDDEDFRCWEQECVNREIKVRTI